MSTPPPSRYRVVERDRRLVVIDTWDKSTAPAGRRPAARSVRSGPMGTVAPPAGIGGLLVNLACVGAADGEGRPILTTMEYYDAKGPREIILSASAARRLGNALSRMAIALPLIVAILWMFPVLLFVLVAGFWAGIAALNSAARPRVTRWIDGLEAQSAT
jgi:hypothetical protein